VDELRLNADPERVERGLAQLVLAVVDLLRELMERQALRRMEAGSLDEEEVERLGTAFMKLNERMEELKEQFELTDEDLELALGPIGNLTQGRRGRMANAQERYYELVLEKVMNDRYPSGELMDRLEAAMASREQLEDYLAVLLEKIESDHYPSKQMLDRVERLAPLAER
jgi:Gas vesicle protein K